MSNADFHYPLSQQPPPLQTEWLTEEPNHKVHACERSNTSAQITERLKEVLSNFKAQSNDCFGWWMSSAMSQDV